MELRQVLTSLINTQQVNVTIANDLKGPGQRGNNATDNSPRRAKTFEDRKEPKSIVS